MLILLVLLIGLPSLEGKNELFVGKKRKKRLAQPSQTDYSRLVFAITIPIMYFIIQLYLWYRFWLDIYILLCDLFFPIVWVSGFLF